MQLKISAMISDLTQSIDQSDYDKIYNFIKEIDSYNLSPMMSTDVIEKINGYTETSIDSEAIDNFCLKVVYKLHVHDCYEDMETIIHKIISADEKTKGMTYPLFIYAFLRLESKTLLKTLIKHLPQEEEKEKEEDE